MRIIFVIPLQQQGLHMLNGHAKIIEMIYLQNIKKVFSFQLRLEEAN